MIRPIMTDRSSWFISGLIVVSAFIRVNIDSADSICSCNLFLKPKNWALYSPMNSFLSFTIPVVMEGVKISYRLGRCRGFQLLVVTLTVFTTVFITAIDIQWTLWINIYNCRLFCYNRNFRLYCYNRWIKWCHNANIICFWYLHFVL